MNTFKSNGLTLETLETGILAGDRQMLGRAITLVESKKVEDQEKGIALVESILPHTGKSFRIGITGAPGVGKSTFIEALGLEMLGHGKKIAILTIDPSSPVSGGSILGDKTRMERLSRSDQVFIRPSPSGQMKGGISSRLREVVLLCEAAGYDLILIETMGVGQSEYEVSHIVDFLLLVLVSGLGDEIQGIKKGIMELVDALVINKEDQRDDLLVAQTKAAYLQALTYVQRKWESWPVRVLSCSSLTGNGIKEVWDLLLNFQSGMKEALGTYRMEQNVFWFREQFNQMVKRKGEDKPLYRKRKMELEKQVGENKISPQQASIQLWAAYVRLLCEEEGI